LGALEGISAGWVPFVQVEDVDGATKRATKLGASVINPERVGPRANTRSSATPVAQRSRLWQKA
jgi:predicted enzyme related to lactoylglutathione lyase